MAGQSRTLKLSILADVDQLKKSLNAANNDVESSSSKLGDFSKKAGLAFAVAGAAAAAYAGKLLIDGVKSAIADEASQLRLANALKNVTGATDAQIAATEAYILKTSLATGRTDDELRPAFERLTRSTKDTTESQKLLALALDIAAAKNLDVTIVANALAKANDGQTGALKKLGITLGDNANNLADYNKLQKVLEKAQLAANFALEEYGPKSKEYIKASAKVAEVTEKASAVAMQGIDIFGELGKEFAGASAAAADTFAGKMERLKVAIDEGKETVGSFVLDAITPMVSTFVDDVVPAISAFATNVGETLQPVIENLKNFFVDFLIPVFKEWWSFLSEVIIPAIISFVKPAFEGLKSAFDSISTALKGNTANLEPLFTLMKEVYSFVLKFLAPVFGTVLKVAFTVIGELIAGLITGFLAVAGAIQTVVNAIKALIKLIVQNPLIAGIGNLISDVFGGPKAMGGPVSSGMAYLVGERGAELFVPKSNGTIVPNNALAASGGTVINLTINGAIDPIGTARAINNVLGNEATTSGSFITLGQSRNLVAL